MSPIPPLWINLLRCKVKIFGERGKIYIFFLTRKKKITPDCCAWSRQRSKTGRYKFWSYKVHSQTLHTIHLNTHWRNWGRGFRGLSHINKNNSQKTPQRIWELAGILEVIQFIPHFTESPEKSCSKTQRWFVAAQFKCTFPDSQFSVTSRIIVRAW